MAEVKSTDEPTIPAKRTSDLTTSLHCPRSQPKKPKFQTHDPNSEPTINGKQTPEPLNDTVSNNQTSPENQVHGVVEEQAVDEYDGGTDKEVIDRKGKGVFIEEDDDEEDDDADDSDTDTESDSGIGDGLSDDSDFDDDSLAEVDLDNILPSRTRRKIIQPGVYLATDIPEEDSDESDDPDA